MHDILKHTPKTELTIKSLPPEILTRIFSYTNWASNVALTCKLFNEVIKNNRVVKLDTLRCIRMFRGKSIEHIIRLGNKLIIINYVSNNTQDILILDSNYLVLRNYEILDVYIDSVNILSCIVGNTCIILLSFFKLYKKLHRVQRNEEYINKFISIIRKILDTHFEEYDYNIIVINHVPDNYGVITKNMYIKVYNKNISRNYETSRFCLDYYSEAIHVTNQCIFFYNLKILYLYNYITNNYIKILDNICTYVKESVIKSCITIFKTLCLPEKIIDTFNSLLDNYELYFKKFLLTDKYLVINYCREHKIIYIEEYIVVFNLRTKKKFTIFKRFDRNDLDDDTYVNWFYGSSYIYLHCVTEDNLYISTINNELQCLYKVNLR